MDNLNTNNPIENRVKKMARILATPDGVEPVSGKEKEWVYAFRASINSKTLHSWETHESSVGETMYGPPVRVTDNILELKDVFGKPDN